MLARIRALVGAAAVLASISVAACRDATAPHASTAPTGAARLAKGGSGGTGGGTPAPATRCARITVTNGGQTVRHAAMPDVKYSLENCGTQAIAATLTVTEVAGFLAERCPAPVAPPTRLTLAVGRKLSATVPVFRGPCGMTSNVDGVVVQGINAWQGHNLQLTLTDDSNGGVLGTAFFSWQDAFPVRP